MKFIHLAVPIILHLVNVARHVVADINHLLPAKGIVCDSSTTLVLEMSKFYFWNQHTVVVIDLSEEPEISRFACATVNNFVAFFLYDDWIKVNFRPKIDQGALSAYSTIEGFYIKCAFKDSLALLPNISSFNPRAKLLINLDLGTFKEAEELLKVAFFKHKMLHVAVFLFRSGFEEGDYVSSNNHSLCFLNPFEQNSVGNKGKGHFKCFNISKVDPEYNKEINIFVRKRVQNLHKFPLRIEIYEESLLSKAVRNERGDITNYEYADGDTVAHLAKRMNFTPIFVNINDSSKHGYKLSNGTFTGSLGLIEDDKADYIAIPIMISDYETKKAYFLNPIAVKQLYFVYRKRENSRKIFAAVFNKLDTTTKFLAFGFTVLLPFVYITINKLESNIMRNFPERSATRNGFYVLSLLSNVSAKHSKLRASRLVVLVILFYSLITTSLLQGKIVENLNYEQDTNRIKTTNELIKQDYKLIMDRSWSTIFKNQSGSEVMNKMRMIANDPQHLVDDSLTGLNMVECDSKIAFLTNGFTRIMNIVEHYEDTTGEDIFDSVDEPVYEFYVAPMIPKNSPFIEIINRWLVQYRESGIQRYQQNIMKREIEKIMIQRIVKGKVLKAKDKSLQLLDLLPFFYLCLMLLLFSVATLIVEILCSSLSSDKKHSYINYNFIL